jgi:hypothetical protein
VIVEPDDPRLDAVPSAQPGRLVHSLPLHALHVDEHAINLGANVLAVP